MFDADKILDLVDETMEELEKRGFCQGEVDFFIQRLEKRVKENSSRQEFYKPFTVFKFPEN